MHVIGIHGDPVAAKRRIDAAKKTGERLGADPYGYKRPSSTCRREAELAGFADEMARSDSTRPSVLDPTAGGGSIPFEAGAAGRLATIANDLNPVAALILARDGRMARCDFGPDGLDASSRHSAASSSTRRAERA